MKFHFIDAEKESFPVKLMCEMLNVSRSGYYRWLNTRDLPDRRLRRNEAKLRRAIRQVHRSSRGAYGRPRIHQILRRKGWKVSAKRIARLLVDEGLRGRGRVRRRKDGGPVDEVSAHILERNFAVAAPNRVWVGDIKQHETSGGIWYIAVVLDLHARRVVGVHVSNRIDAGLVCQALRVAVDAREPEHGSLTFHSDQGIQYRSQRFRLMLRARGITQSMSRRGNCWDNAPMESFFATLELECLRAQPCNTGDDLRAAIRNYIRFYNTRRVHSTLGYVAPAKFESSTTKPVRT